MNAHQIVVCLIDSNFSNLGFFLLLDLESTNLKKETIKKKPIVKKKNNFIHHFPQPTQIVNNNNNNNSHSHPPPLPPSYNMTNFYQQPFYGQYSIPTSYSHVEHFQ